MTIGLAPEVPEDLYMLIKKVRKLAQIGIRTLYMMIDFSLSLGRRCPQAPRAQPQGQGLQVPSHSHRIQNPPPEQILQDRRCPATQLEIRERHRKHTGRIDVSLKSLWVELCLYEHASTSYAFQGI